jgi:hypothetical protein
VRALLPQMFAVHQTFDLSHIADIRASTSEALLALRLAQRIQPGMRIGIPVGSRGISQIVPVLSEAVRAVQAQGAIAVLVAAMGSHGGGTAEGHLKVLSQLGVTAEALGAPIYGSVDVVEISTLPDGTSIYFDKRLRECDALLVINRVKPHTSFHGPLESGLVKMLVVGCGKVQGAETFHRCPAEELSQRLEMMGREILRSIHVLGGLALLENGRKQIESVTPVWPDRLIEQEAELLVKAKALLPRLPVQKLDLLVVDRIGKDITGTGMDTNVIGRTGIPEVDPVGPKIRRIVALDLSDGSHGNANGVGLADLVTQRLVNKIDFKTTYLNTLTATFVERAKLPITLRSDREVIEAALRTIGSPVAPRIIRIQHTAALAHMWVSEALIDEVLATGAAVIDHSSSCWSFDAGGNLF